MAYRTLSASVRAASLTLTGSLVTVLGTVSTDNANSTTGAIKLGDLSVVRLQCTYTSATGSTTGRPIFAFDVSMDSPDTAAGSVSHWVPVYLIDASAFPGTLYVNGYAYEFSPAPTIAGGGTANAASIGTPPIDVRAAQWLRVRVADVDGVTPGAISLLTFGGEV